jgi:hypothetical protein
MQAHCHEAWNELESADAARLGGAHEENRRNIVVGSRNTYRVQ